MARRVIPWMTVGGHGACVMPHPSARRRSNRTNADPSLPKKPQSQPHPIDLVVHDTPVGVGFVSPQTLLRLLVGLLGAVALVFEPCTLLAQRAMGLGPLRGLTCPWLAAVSALGRVGAHPASGPTP